MPALLVQGLTISLHGKPLVEELDFSIEPGEKLALLGPSGSGKSLTAAALLGQLPAGMNATGTLRVNGKEIPLRGRRHAGREFAGIHQNPAAALNPLVRLGRQLAMPLRNAGLSGPEAREISRELLASVGLADADSILRGFSGELSGGQLQRICIAMALACRADILVADEPTTALDVVNQARVLEILAGVPSAAGGLLLITHDLAAAEQICGRAVVLQDGRKIEEAHMPELIARPRHPYTAALVASARSSFAPPLEVAAA